MKASNGFSFELESTSNQNILKIDRLLKKL